VDRAGNAILGSGSRAANVAASDLQEARAAAVKLADQLRAAHKQINDLKANVRQYQDRTNRAEKWLQLISSEIEHKLLSVDERRPVRRPAPQQPPRGTLVSSAAARSPSLNR
jgi:DNA repair exonuclease SbcCD ATPase subunit